MPKPDLSAFSVKKPIPRAQPAEEKPAPKAVAPKPAKIPRTRKTKAFELTPEAVREFEILRAETGKKSYELAAEAMNLLFKKYKKPEVA